MNDLTVAEAAAELGMSEQGIRARIGRGDMRARRVGARLWLISRREVEKWKIKGKIREGRPPGPRAEVACRAPGKQRPGPKPGSHRKEESDQ